MKKSNLGKIWYLFASIMFLVMYNISIKCLFYFAEKNFVLGEIYDIVLMVISLILSIIFGVLSLESLWLLFTSILNIGEFKMIQNNFMEKYGA